MSSVRAEGYKLLKLVPFFLGNMTLIKEDTRAIWASTVLDRLGQDPRYAVSAAGRKPGFAAIVVLTLDE